jgi:hypothetical protein
MTASKGIFGFGAKLHPPRTLVKLPQRTAIDSFPPRPVEWRLGSFALSQTTFAQTFAVLFTAKRKSGANPALPRNCKRGQATVHWKIPGRTSQKPGSSEPLLASQETGANYSP